MEWTPPSLRGIRHARNVIRSSHPNCQFAISPVWVSTQYGWNTRFAKSSPYVVASIWGLRSVSGPVATPLWHIDDDEVEAAALRKPGRADVRGLRVGLPARGSRPDFPIHQRTACCHYFRSTNSLLIRLTDNTRTHRSTAFGCPGWPTKNEMSTAQRRLRASSHCAAQIPEVAVCTLTLKQTPQYSNRR